MKNNQRTVLNCHTILMLCLSFWLGLLSLFTGTPAAFAQGAPNFLWVRQANATVNGFGKGLFTDTNGYSYVTGYFDGTNAFGTNQLNSYGLNDIFVAKYDKNGTLIWARHAGTVNGEEGLSITADSAGNCFVTGWYNGATANFGTTNLNTFGGQDIFVAKYDNAGVLQWAARAGANANDNGIGIAADSLGDCYVTGHYAGNANFSGTTLTNGGGFDLFVAKYSGAGALQWVRRAGGSGTERGSGIGVDSQGNCYVAGPFNSSAVNFDGITVTNAGGNDFFLAKYDTSGTIQWVRRGGGSGADQGRDVAVDPAGNSFVTGVFNGNAAFGTNTLTSAGSNDVFVAKYDTLGTLLWIRQGGGLGNEDDFGGGIKVDGSGNCYVTGAYLLNATFGGVTLTNAGDHDIFVAKYNSDGTFQWVQRAGGPGYDYCRQVGIDGTGNVYLTGTFRSNATFGSFTVTLAGTSELFIAKLGTNLTSNLQLAIAETNHSVSLSIFAVPGQSVLIDRAASLSAPTVWLNWTNLILPVSPYTIPDLDSTNLSQHFYRGRLP